MEQLRVFDRQIYDQGFRYLIGIDEAGRGPLAGPVVAAAVLLKTAQFSLRIQDSKKMTARQRHQAFLEIQENAHVGIGIMNERIVDTYNILQATFLAMNEAVRQLHFSLRQTGVDINQDIKKVCLLIDGNRFRTYLPYGYQTVIGGDGKSLAIACASIIAKVTRDRILEQYHQVFPQYGFDQHKGYPTAAHRKALEEHGPALIHRKTFRTVRDVCRA